MTRILALIGSGSLTIIITTFVLALIFAPSFRANQTNLTSDTFAAESSSPAQPQQAEFVATAQTLNQTIETTINERERLLKDQITQRQTAMAGLDQTSQAEINALQAKLLELQAQIEQKQANIPAIQTYLSDLQKVIEADTTAYENQLSSMSSTETQLRQELEAATAELNTFYSQLAQQQPTTPATGEGENYHEYDDDDDEGEYHEEDDD
jgi:SMC interacting uncharacterized protein involved in chromosome segregation